MLERIRKEVPAKPGCYIYRDKHHQIIYIGKAKNLSKRMASYFNRVQNLKTTKLVSEIADFEYFITNTERESLILENRLIKEHQPKYNIMLKDDKTYPYILITSEAHPRVLKVRQKKMKGTYYGPYPDNAFVNMVIEYINRNSMLRKCRTLPKEECIYYHLKQCYAPCIKYFTPEEVKAYTEEVKEMLENNMSKLNRRLKEEMQVAAENLDFESAASLRDISLKISEYRERQVIDVKTTKDFDVIGMYKDKTDISLAIMNFRGGYMVNIDYLLNSYYTDVEDTLSSMLFNYYDGKDINMHLSTDENVNQVMQSLILSEPMSAHLIDYQEILELSRINAKEYLRNNVERLRKKMSNQTNKGFTELETLANRSLPIIEMYDISHLGGDAQVAGKVVYERGKKNPKLYRKYKIKTAKAADEYGSMYEVLFRRLSRVASGEEDAPSLILLDGGKGQMSMALQVLEELELDVPMLALVKDDNHKTRAMLNKNYQEMKLDHKSNLYKFLYDVQEEVHRYAIDFHHKSKNNEMLKSELDQISGLGPVRKKNLMLHFKTIDNIKSASVEELQECKLPLNIAKNIVEYFSEE